MVFFAVDDKLHDHAKARRAQKAAIGVWALAGSWCGDNLTDGFVPAAVLPRWGTKADVRRLVEARLWHTVDRDGQVVEDCDDCLALHPHGLPNAEAGWLFHDWPSFQPTARDVTLKRDSERRAGSFGNHKRWHLNRGVRDPELCGWCRDLEGK